MKRYYLKKDVKQPTKTTDEVISDAYFIFKNNLLSNLLKKSHNSSIYRTKLPEKAINRENNQIDAEYLCALKQKLTIIANKNDMNISISDLVDIKTMELYLEIKLNKNKNHMISEEYAKLLYNHLSQRLENCDLDTVSLQLNLDLSKQDLLSLINPLISIAVDNERKIKFTTQSIDDKEYILNITLSRKELIKKGNNHQYKKLRVKNKTF